MRMKGAGLRSEAGGAAGPFDIAPQRGQFRGGFGACPDGVRSSFALEMAHARKHDVERLHRYQREGIGNILGLMPVDLADEAQGEM